MRRLACALILLALPRCSLVAGQFDVPGCRTQQDCEVLNAGAGPCSRYVCVLATHRCVSGADADADGDRRVGCGGSDCDDADALRSSRAREVCDGADNDCDQAIDEGVIELRGAAPVAPAPGGAERLSLTGAGPSAALSWRSASGGRASVAFTRDGRIDGAVTTDIGFARHSSDDLAQPITLQPGCAGAGVCAAAELALDIARDGREWFAAAVNVSGCAMGDLRVGYGVPGASTGLSLASVGPLARGASADGVGGCVGASHPVISRLSDATATPQALLAWLGGAQGAQRCGEQTTLRAIGLWLEGGATSVPWVNTTNGGAPQDLGAVSAGGGPAIAPWARADGAVGFGWFLAAIEPTGGIRVRFVPPPGEPPAFSAALPAQTPRASSPLRIDAASTVVNTAHPGPGALSIAVGSTGAEGVSIGVSWIDRCGGGDVFFARVRYRDGGGFSADAPVRLSSGARAPQSAIRWVRDGLVTADHPAVAGRGPENLGGWLVLWADGGRVFGRRVLGVNGAAIDDAAVPLSQGTTLASPALQEGNAQGQARAFWVNLATPEIQTGVVSCRQGS